ncbi:MAG: hypothetical protein AAF497_24090, partial [Planctomycetota bacterium]
IIPIADPVSSTMSGPGGTLTLNTPEGSVSLELGSASIAHSDLGTLEFVFGAAPTTVNQQNLPWFLCDPVSLSFSQTIDAGTLTDDGINVTGFTSFGTGEIISVPEPTTTATFLGLFGITLLRVTRRRDY